MHGKTEAEFLSDVSGFLGSYYILLGVINAVAALYLWQSGRIATYFKIGRFQVTNVLVWLLTGVAFTIISPLAYSGNPELMNIVSFPQWLRDLFDSMMSPQVYTIGTVAALGVMYYFRKFFVKPAIAWTMLNLSLLFMGMSINDPDFALIVTKPDNVPIVGLLFLLGYFTWLATYKAVKNDERIEQGLGPLEAEDKEKVLVWPDLVYTELICMVALTALLIVWGIALQAPLEEPASSVKTPNPSKAPWYFLGLQEMLVYYDPWMAGVVLPSLVVFGLMAIPFIDFNKKGSGYYTINERKFAYLTFQFGFLVLWITLIVMGTFLRGPNWNFFGPYENWDPHKVEALNNVDLSEYFWVEFLGRGRPKAPNEASGLTQFGYILVREAPGILLVLAYFIIVPPALVLYFKSFREMFLKMGFLRYMTLAMLLLFMALLPIKMVLRWTLNLKYFISIPEFLLNF